MRVRNPLLRGLVAGTAVFAMSACSSQTPAADTAAPATATTQASAPAAPAANGCPATASALQKVSGLDAGYKIDESSIKCKENWATAAVTAPSIEQQGDGVIFFQYDATTGEWANKGEGSDVPCGGDMGIPASTGLCNPDA
ncbi:hypothetical protein [Actinoplanes subglobosus]|uniref:Lipoprotein n=1 Tax=Actinoplanes subglobosus TaxID=1547892 RepID=A0ABV8IIC3_9ACTN